MRVAFLLVFLTTHPVSAQVRTQPFYLERAIGAPDASGVHKIFKREIIVRRSDGSTVRASSVGDDVDAGLYVRQITFAAGNVISAYDPIRVKTSWTKESSGGLADVKAVISSNPRDCDVRAPQKLIRFDKVQGQDVVILQDEEAGKYRVTRWLAPSIGCEDLYYKSEALDGNIAKFFTAEGKTIRFVLGEPDAKWFQVGPEFEEVNPSEANKRLLQRLGQRPDPAEAALIEGRGKADDARYRLQNQR